MRDSDPIGRLRHGELLCDFANTLDVDVDAETPDALADPSSLTRWLASRELIQPLDEASDDELIVAHELRRELRDAMRHHGRRDAAVETDLRLASVAHELHLQVRFDHTHPRLAPAVDGVRGGLARILIAVVEAEAGGDWERLKLCAATDCAIAFRDGSKNRSRQWCSMSECGNRQKTRTYRARHRETG